MESKCYTLPDGTKIYKDRGVGVVMAAFTKDSSLEEPELYVLACKRGPKMSDSPGLWNLPSGHLDWDEDGTEAAIRETREECGVYIPYEWVSLEEVSTRPSEHKQNVIFRYMCLVPKSWLKKGFRSQGLLSGEVAEIAWIPIKELDNYKFAYNHNLVIKRFLEKIADLPIGVMDERNLES